MLGKLYPVIAFKGLSVYAGLDELKVIAGLFQRLRFIKQTILIFYV